MIDFNRIFEFNINPIGKPRMVRSDSWSGRKAVSDFWLYKDQLNIEAKKIRFVLEDSFEVYFYLPMPKSWSRVKRIRMIGKPHQQKPDLDNLFKAFSDSLTDDDKKICFVKMGKYWAESGKIVVYA